MNKVIAELEKQMKNAAFSSAVEEHVDELEILILLICKVRGITPDQLVIILSIVIGRLLISACPDKAREHYTGVVKSIIDRYVAPSSKE